MKLPIAFAVLLAAVAAQAADTSGSDPAVPVPTVQERLANARKALGQNDWGGALRELNVAVREAPGNADVHNLLGYTYRKRAQPDLGKAFDHYRMALKIDPRHKGAHEYIGEAYLLERRPQEAEMHLVELEKICGNRSCEEYQDLAGAIAKFKAGR